MRHYDDAYDKRDEYENTRKLQIEKIKSELIAKLSTEEMIKIMFQDFINKQDISNLEKLSKQFI